jgi:hypothetical protein
MLNEKDRAVPDRTTPKITQPSRSYHPIADTSRENSFFMAARILLLAELGLYTPGQQKSVLPVVDALLRSYAGRGNHGE